MAWGIFFTYLVMAMATVMVAIPSRTPLSNISRVAPPPGLQNIKDFIHPLLIYFNTAHPTVMISVIN